MSTAEFPTQITTQLFDVVSRKSTYLSSDISSVDTTIPVDSTSGFSDKGYITIENETIYYPSKTSIAFTSCTRGFSGTAVSHLTDTQVKLAIVAETINKIHAEIIATQQKIGVSGEATNTTTIEYKLRNLPTQDGSTVITKLNANYLQGLTSGQFLYSGSTAADSSKLTNISGTTIIENDIEFTPDSFNTNNDNPPSQIDIAGDADQPRVLKVEFGNTDYSDLPAFKMPRSYNGGTITWSIIYCSSTAESVFDIGICAIAASAGTSYNPVYGTPVYLGNITCSATTGLVGYTSKDVAGVSLGLTNSALNYVRILGGTTCAVQILNSGLRWNKG